ncbi:MAG: hypothetical protein HRT68_12830 [Flavobacteriaceae bacterium]|nr:hypothetical protein [Flavobacteriaceae bacterium]
MGTHIDCIIPKEREYTTHEVIYKLESVFNRLKAEFRHLEKYSAFSEYVDGKWWVKLIPEEENTPEYITGEGASFSIDIYKNVIVIGCIERFSNLYDLESKIFKQLVKIIIEFSNEFRVSDKIIIGAGGNGETDQVLDIAHYENADFDQICKLMTKLNGLPAADFNELSNKSWYLKN